MIRMHVSLDTPQLSTATAFYRALFDAEPSLAADDYTRFVLDDPGLVLTLNAGPKADRGRLNHMGVRVPDAAAVRAARGRLVAAGLAVRDELNVDCCYALQDKFWISDPDGNPWEVYTVLQADTRPEPPPVDLASVGETADLDEGACCPPSCCP